MRIFLAGATGAIGSRLVPQLVAAGHTVVGTTRHASKSDRLRFIGAEPAVLDPLDPAAVTAAVEKAAPDVLVHQLTALSGAGSPRAFTKAFKETNRLRSEGTDILLAAGRAVGVRRVVAQSFGGWPYARTGGPVKTEDDPLDPHPARAAAPGLAAIRHLEEAVTGYGEGLALRRRRARPGARVAARAGHGAGGAAAAARAGMAGPPPDRRALHGDDDHGPRHVQREGQARARLDSGVPDLARGFPGDRRR
jgi:hypothetical protein